MSKDLIGYENKICKALGKHYIFAVLNNLFNKSQLILTVCSSFKFEHRSRDYYMCFRGSLDRWIS